MSKAVDPKDVQKAFLESLSFLEICSIEKTDIQNAAELSWPDFEDCLIHIAAEKVKADFIVTRDKQGFQHAKTPTKTIGEIISILAEDYHLDFKELVLASKSEPNNT